MRLFFPRVGPTNRGARIAEPRVVELAAAEVTLALRWEKEGLQAGLQLA